MEPGDIYRACTDATAAYLRGAGFADAVIGLSGGVDSSLVAAMAADALGAPHVHGVLLPGPYSSDHSVADALALARNLRIEAVQVPITQPYEAFARQIGEAMGNALSGTAAENTQARCRMVVLMALSNQYGWMMLNTGNKSEAALGYSTLYGDTAGAFAPIGALYKTQVYALCAWRNEQARRRGETPPIPQRVLDKPPSAELAPGQTDEGSLGIGYAELDGILLAAIEHGGGAAGAVAAGYAEDAVRDVLARYEAAAFKRALEPPCATGPFYG